jgi:hypothetical protein
MAGRPVKQEADELGRLRCPFSFSHFGIFALAGPRSRFTDLLEMTSVVCFE